MPNDYSLTWFDLFLYPIQPAQTDAEIAFITRHLPLPDYASVVDLCCGPGRHAGLLAARGYRVLGIDQNAEVLAAARRTTSGVTYLQRDMRQLGDVPGTFDAVLNLWQSFGHFDEATNRDVLRQVGETLCPGGRFILDIYHRHFFERHEGTRHLERNGLRVTESKEMRGNRLTVRLDYGEAGGSDTFTWQLYTPEEITALAGDVGLRLLVACARFDEQRPPSAEEPRMQLVFEKV